MTTPDSSRTSTTRRQFIGSAAAAWAGMALGGPVWGNDGPNRRPPNIVICLADDLGFADIGCFHQAGAIRTPNIDRLATQGVRCHQFYACPNCSPSRATLLTGRVPTRTGLYSYVTDNSPMHLRAEEVTIAQRLKDRGYATCLLGKWHLNSGLVDPKHPGQAQPSDLGFDHVFATKANASPHNANPDNFVRNGEALGPLRGYGGELVTDEAISWVDRQRQRNPDKPFFLYAAYQEPHESGLQAPRELIDQYKDADHGSDRLGPRIARHMATVTLMDREIGRLIDHLDARGLGDDTVVLFVSDNGSRFEPRNQPLREGKSAEGGIRVPAVWRRPGRIQPGSTTDALLALEDLMPTLCAAAGTTAPRDRTIDGVDITAALEGKRFERPRPKYSYFYRTDPSGALHARDHKLLVHFTRRPGGLGHGFDARAMQYIQQARPERFELYNLHDDPSESNDLSQQQPELTRRMAEAFTEYHRDALRDGPVWS